MEMKTVKEIAEMFGVTKAGVYYWIKEGLPYQEERVIGIKPRKVIDPQDVKDFLKLTQKTFTKGD